MTGVTIVNFSHPITSPQLADIVAALGRPVNSIIEVPTHFDSQQPYGPQAEALVNGAGLDARAWQTEPIVVNLPSFNVIAALVLARLHGLMGHFPAIVRIRPTENILPQAFEFAELIDLNQFRERSADRGR